MARARMEYVETLYLSGAFSIFEAIPKPVYRNAAGQKFVYDYRSSRRRGWRQLGDILNIEKLLPKKIDWKVVFDNEQYLGLEDSKGRFYRFRKFDKLPEWMKESMGTD